MAWAWQGVTETSRGNVQMWLIGALFLLAGSMASLLWSQQQSIIQQLSDRIGRMEVACKVDWTLKAEFLPH